eukprot:TRINITY_DN12309_c0_g1_i1.p1 TRINITY_DN12309_c0_g1~~TRINITY_DN12309_c0_g1_i1.p1  ORF type:complete len:122 (+),score=9.95 TRINITY_DN12309_c0_g1_i1:51-416(+)
MASMVRFGTRKYHSRPKTEEQWRQLYLKNKHSVPQIRRIVVSWSSQGPGQTGTRRFKGLDIQPLMYWNKNIEVFFQKNIGKQSDSPSVVVQLLSGADHTIRTQNMKSDEILKEVCKLGASE